MAKLTRTGYIVTVYAELEVYEHLFNDILTAHENAQDYVNAGCQTRVTIAYSIED